MRGVSSTHTLTHKLNNRNVLRCCCCFRIHEFAINLRMLAIGPRARDRAGASAPQHSDDVGLEEAVMHTDPLHAELKQLELLSEIFWHS
jgi:hypothetical protein